jgi:ubiquinone/menaquinone biosynthesis C-methylase UbiE
MSKYSFHTVNESSACRNYLAEVRRYYDEVTPLYLKYFSSTLQAIRPRDVGQDVGAVNRFWFPRIGIDNVSRILDCGCGVAGPALDLAETYSEIVVDGVTISQVQANLAQHEVSQRFLNDRVEVIVADYHHLPFRDSSYDIVIFLESLGYAYNLLQTLLEVRRVLVPGGRLYIKDLFVPSGELNREEQTALAEFNRIYHYRSLTIDHLVTVLNQLRFQEIETTDLRDIVSVKQIHEAMFEMNNSGSLCLNAFGRRHRPQCSVKANPVLFMEVKALN